MHMLQPLLESILENIVEPCNSSSKSSNLGIGKRYLMVMLLKALLSMHMHQVPSFLGTNKAGTAHGLMLSRTYPVIDGDEAAPPLKLIHLVGDCIFLLKLDELNASFMEVFNLIH